MKILSQDGLSTFRLIPSKSGNGGIFKGKIIRQNVRYEGKHLATMVIGKRLWWEVFLGSYDSPVEAGSVTREIVERLQKGSKVYEMPVFETLQDFESSTEDD